MFGFVKQIFISAMMLFGCNLSSVNSLKCVSINNQECKVRPQIVNVKKLNIEKLKTVHITFSMTWLILNTLIQAHWVKIKVRIWFWIVVIFSQMAAS